MKKGELSGETIVILILAVLLAAAIIGGFNIYSDFTQTEGNKQVIKSWVRSQGLFEKYSGPIEGVKQTFTGEQDRPPISELEEPYKIKKTSDLMFDRNNPPKAFEEIADSIYDCWDAFEKGQVNFLNTINKNAFCYPCRIIKFSDNVKNEFPEIKGFTRFLNEYKPISGLDTPTYLQLLANDKNLKLDDEDLEDDTIATDKDLYIMFFAASGRTWGDIAMTIGGFDDFIEEDLNEKKYTATSVSGEKAVEFEGSEEEVTGLRAATAASALAAGGLASKGYLLKQNFFPGKYSAEKTGAELSRISKGAKITKAEIEIAEDGAKKLSYTFTDDAEKKGAKALSKYLTKKMALQGVRILGSKLNLFATIGIAGYGAYKVTFGDKPFQAEVVLADPEKISELCNGAPAKEENKIEGKKAESVSANLDKAVPSIPGGL
ncbi:hypothetical protein J4440_06030 [Candidatus Woesearchaeota archaeon]|nr:hypothetical protein [Candidatus Woesearchaeota archaeon]